MVHPSNLHLDLLQNNTPTTWPLTQHKYTIAKNNNIHKISSSQCCLLGMMFYFYQIKLGYIPK